MTGKRAGAAPAARVYLRIFAIRPDSACCELDVHQYWGVFEVAIDFFLADPSPQPLTVITPGRDIRAPMRQIKKAAECPPGGFTLIIFGFRRKIWIGPKNKVNLIF